MMYSSKNECGEASGERLADIEELGLAEELAYAALARKLGMAEDEPHPEPELLTIADDEITSRGAQRLTLNSRHNIAFLKERFPYRFCLDGSYRVAAFPRDEVEQYMNAYLEAEAIPDGYRGRRITSLVTETRSLESIFRVMRDIGVSIRLFSKPSGRLITEYIDEEFIELVELGLTELEQPQEVDESVDDDWRPLGLKEQLQAVSVPNRDGYHRTSISWNDDLVEITRIPPQSKPATPAWLRKPKSATTAPWQPRYIRNLGSLTESAVALEQLDSPLGINATVALAARQRDLARINTAIGIDAMGRPAVAGELTGILSELIASTEYSGAPIPDSWQALDDIAKDANVKLEGEGGLEAWVAEGAYGPEHVITIPYHNVNERSRLTFCSPQLARVIVDWVSRERQRLERAVELEERYGRPGYDVVAPVVFEDIEPVVDQEDEEEFAVDAIEELRAKLQSLETFAAQHSLETQWIYELVHANYDAYIVDYVTDGRKRVAHFATTEGIEYLLANLAPPEYRTSRQICDAYGIPLYLFDVYAGDTEPVGDFLSTEWCANVQPMPHYDPGRISRILSSYYDDVAEEPMRIADIAMKSGQTALSVIDYLTRHGVVVDSKRTVLRQAGHRYIWEHREIGVADETSQIPTLFLMRTREVRGSDLRHADITTMCYELNIPLETLRNVPAKKTTQHAPADRFPDLQAAIERYYLRSR